jgi:hypothetical protein
MVRWHTAGVAAALVEVERIADAQQRAQALCRTGGGKRIATPEEVLSVFARTNTRQVRVKSFYACPGDMMSTKSTGRARARVGPECAL